MKIILHAGEQILVPSLEIEETVKVNTLKVWGPLQTGRASSRRMQTPGTLYEEFPHTRFWILLYTFTSKYYAVVLTIPFHSAFTTCA